MGRRAGGHEQAWMHRRVRTVGCKRKVKWVLGRTGMSERGCAEVCRQFGCKEKVGNGRGEGPVGMSERGCADVCGRCG